MCPRLAGAPGQATTYTGLNPARHGGDRGGNPPGAPGEASATVYASGPLWTEATPTPVPQLKPGARTHDLRATYATGPGAPARRGHRPHTPHAERSARRRALAWHACCSLHFSCQKLNLHRLAYLLLYSIFVPSRILAEFGIGVARLFGISATVCHTRTGSFLLTSSLWATGLRLAASRPLTGDVTEKGYVWKH